ncbi:MAG: hypothetical protein JWR19_3158 [Pedosphaera sp.]|nr:hypothetical protein [Pedosphaera sp.]
MNLLKKQPASSLLGLAFDAGRLEGVVLRRTNGSLEVQKTFSAPLSIDLLTHDPELVGREILNHLEAEGIRERRCAVCVPLSWALTLQTKLPELSEADLSSLLQLEAERGFHYGADALLIATSRYRSPGGDAYAMQLAIPRDHLTRLEQALKAARLKPVTFSLGIIALQGNEPETSGGVIALALGENSVGLQISCAGGLAALRTLEGAFETEGSAKRLQTDQVAREIRITLGQLPPDERAALRRLRIFGGDDLSRQLAEEMRSRMEPAGIQVEWVRSYPANEFQVKLPTDTVVSPALSLAARHMVGQSQGFEFLPPKISLWKQFSGRYSSKKLVYAGATAGSVVLVVVLAFLVQQIQLMSLNSQWHKMEPKVKELNDLQAQIQKYRPWFGGSLRCLNIMRELTQAFPEDGSVTAKTIEIRDPSIVTCSGTTRDRPALLKALDHLRSVNQIDSVKIDRVSGKSPMQFTFSFHWGEGGSHEN